MGPMAEEKVPGLNQCLASVYIYMFSQRNHHIVLKMDSAALL